MLISSGIASLDNLIGGGFYSNQLVLIDEDLFGAYAKVLLKYFLAEGIASEQPLFVASLDSSPEDIVNDLPGIDENALENPQRTEENMKIAFRYQNLPTASQESSNCSHFFDLSTSMDPNLISQASITYWNESSNLDELYNKIKTRVEALKDQTSILRLAISSLGSPMWLNTLDNVNCLNKFFYQLRGLVKSSNIVGLVTVPCYLYTQVCLERCFHNSDIVIRLQSFSGTHFERNKALSEYHGFFQFLKVAPHNSLASKVPGCVEYAFKLRRKKFVISVLHLPPDLGESNVQTGCGSSRGNNLDF